MVLSKVRKPIEQYAIQPEALVLSDMLQRLLDTTVGLFEQQGVPLPERRYWMLGGEVPEDCEQVVVTFLQSYLGAPGDQAADPQQCNQPRTGVFNIFITREHPTGESGQPVSTNKIIADSKWGAVDASVLMWGLNDLSAMPDGWAGPGVIATVNVSPPNGGVQTTVLNISLMIS